jgi:hypothetical protein
MLGLDAAGKTTILYKLHIGEILSTVPTIGKVWRAAQIFMCVLNALLCVRQASRLIPVAFIVVHITSSRHNAKP